MRIETLFEGVGLFAGMDLALLIVKSKDPMIKELELPFLDYVHEHLADRKTMSLRLIQLGDEKHISFLLVNGNIVSPFSQGTVPLLEELMKSLENQPIVDGAYLLPEDHVAYGIHFRLWDVFSAGQEGKRDNDSWSFPAPEAQCRPFQLDATAEARQSRLKRYLGGSQPAESDADSVKGFHQRTSSATLTCEDIFKGVGRDAAAEIVKQLRDIDDVQAQDMAAALVVYRTRNFQDLDTTEFVWKKMVIVGRELHIVLAVTAKGVTIITNRPAEQTGIILRLVELLKDCPVDNEFNVQLADMEVECVLQLRQILMALSAGGRSYLGMASGEEITQSPEEEILRVADKVIMHTSAPHKLTVEALDAAEGLKGMDGHLFAYVTQDNRVISFSQPAKWADGELGRDQKIVYAPAYDKLDTK